ncbi:LTA synthase family protein [Peribacillus huizhouensis]|uniref:Lipoteichoic acid synthase n=1 Tax=Peribacillus huizhouensis TaxID=1501239 RepID=A0ABR6CJS4_9BACI|nr:LTA synthase family protein [Peribacillus huizhouensis]MBA9025321.1 lipoteichoic acid synthase [Peribacillus huizhouensis]
MTMKETRVTPKLLFLFACTCMWLKTVIVSFIGFDIAIHSWFDALLLIVNPIGSLLLLIGFSIYFTKRLHMKWLLVIMLFITGLLYGDLLYYRFYIDFVTVSILFQFKNVGGIGPSTFELMQVWDLLLFVDVLIIALFTKKIINQPNEISARFKKRFIGFSTLLLILLAGLGWLRSPYLFSASFNRELMVKSIGPYNYHLYDIAMGLRPTIDRAVATHVDTAKIEEYMASKKDDTTDLFGIAKGKNVVLISMESTQNFVINRKVNDREITPFLNDLIKESFYFNQIYDQTAQGKTSDSEFMIDTSLYPLSGGSVFVRRPGNTFTSLQRLLRENGQYYSASFHGNDASFWNREKMYENLGYDRFFSKQDYVVTDENSVNYGIKDIPFFEQSVELMKTMPEPYLAKLITLTNHFPFLLDETDQLIAMGNTDEDVVNRYVTTVRYQDEAIKRLFQTLKDHGMYEDTIFVLYGDHYGISKKYEVALSQMLGDEYSPINHIQYRQVPVIIHIPGEGGKTISVPGGEIDIRPTLLHLLGIKTEHAISFGHNLFTRSPNHPVIFRDGGFVNDTYIFQDGVCYRKGSGEQLNNATCEPYRQTVYDELGLSDEIIFGDLLRFTSTKD